jgi:predicted RNA-binding protein with PUA-like domain
MAYWLVKDEPESWSYQMHAKEGVASWDGVRNYQAANNLRAMKKGDRAFFYHSVTEKRLAGVLEVVREAYPDPTAALGHAGQARALEDVVQDGRNRGLDARRQEAWRG